MLCNLLTENSWNHVLQYLEESHRETQDKLTRIHTSIQSIVSQQQQMMAPKRVPRGSTSRDIYLVVLVLALCQVVLWLYWKKWFRLLFNIFFFLFLCGNWRNIRNAITSQSKYWEISIYDIWVELGKRKLLFTTRKRRKKEKKKKKSDEVRNN